MFGYGLYMYDLQSLKLTEAESKVRRLERSEHSQSSELKQLKNAKNELEEKLKKVGISIQSCLFLKFLIF